MSAMPVMLGVLIVLWLAFRYYSRFLAAKVLGLDDGRVTPAHCFNDGKDFHPTNRWVLFGHHFAAIAGAGPLIGPVLAIQFGYLPGLIWLVVGVCLAGAVQDMTVLFASTRRDGKSLVAIVRSEMGPVAGTAALLGILYIIIIALAGLGIVVVKALGGEEIKFDKVRFQPPAAVASESAAGLPDGRMAFTPEEGSKYRWPTAQANMDFPRDAKLVLPKGSELPGDGESELPAGSRMMIRGSSWGAFTIACTIPIALFVGWYMNKLRKGKVLEASLIGAVLVLGATFAGAYIPNSALSDAFDWTRETTIGLMAIYGFIAAVLPVWVLLGPRDYLSSFLKIGTIALLVLGVVVANPTLQAPAINPQFIGGNGPYFDGPVFPYVFICIMCGAISGFHSLVSSGTTPKMLDRESDIRMIGYGAMLCEGLVGVVALIAAASLDNTMYYEINVELSQLPRHEKDLAALGVHLDGDHGGLQEMEEAVDEPLHGRTGGAVTLAVGMAKILQQAIPGSGWLVNFWYHFAIMFEALFILTTIDAGTRIGRFLVQEIFGKISPRLGRLDSWVGSLIGTLIVVLGWAGFIYTGSVATIWPMFGMANQLLAVIALATVTTVLFHMGKGKYAWVTILPMIFVTATTSTAAVYELRRFWRMMKSHGGPWSDLQGYLNIGLTIFMLACTAVIVVAAIAHWRRAGSAKEPEAAVA